MFDAYKRFFRFSGTEKSTWYKGMAFELLRSIFEALQFVALLIVLRALVEQNITGATAWTALGIMVVSVAGAALCWYLAHNSEGHANYRMCGEKRIHIGERMKYMPMGYFNAQSLGSLTAAATSTMSDLESMSFAVIARTVVGMIRTAVFLWRSCASTGESVLCSLLGRCCSFGSILDCLRNPVSFPQDDWLHRLNWWMLCWNTYRA